MFSLVGKSYRAPFTEFVGLWNSFRVSILFTVALLFISYSALKMILVLHPGLTIDTIFTRHPILILFAVLVVVGIFYALALFAGGMVAWHRNILSGDNEAKGQLLLQRTDWRYFGYLVLFFLSVMLLSVFVARCMEFLFPLVQSSIVLYLIVVAHPLLIVIFIAFIFRTVCMRLPALALEGRGAYARRDLVIPYTRKWQWLLVLSCVVFPIFGAPILFSYIFEIVVATDYVKQFLPVSDAVMDFIMLTPFVSICKQALALYFWSVLASLLTFYYRDNIREDVLREVAKSQAAAAE